MSTMRLKDYLSKENEMPQDFSKRSGVRLATIYSLKNGRQPVLTTKTMLKIVAATNGAVRLEDLI